MKLLNLMKLKFLVLSFFCAANLLGNSIKNEQDLNGEMKKKILAKLECSHWVGLDYEDEKVEYYFYAIQGKLEKAGDTVIAKSISHGIQEFDEKTGKELPFTLEATEIEIMEPLTQEGIHKDQYVVLGQRREGSEYRAILMLYLGHDSKGGDCLFLPGESGDKKCIRRVSI